MKSKFYKDVQKGLTTLAELYKKGATYKHRNGAIEYIYAYDWDAETKAKHPEFSDYCIRAFYKDDFGLMSKGQIIDREKKKDVFFWQPVFKWGVRPSELELYNALGGNVLDDND